MKIVLQDGIKDCGVCCLLSIIKHYGGNVSKEYLRELTNTKLDYILLKEDMIKHSIFIECIKNIEYYLKNYKTMDDNDYKNWLHKQNELLGRNTNFFYRKTIYKVK